MVEDTEQTVDRRSRRLRRRHAVVLVAIVVAVACVFAYASAVYRGFGAEAKHTRAAACPVVRTPPPTVAPKLIYLNVLNGTDRAGLADEVAARLERRDFHIISVTNSHSQDPITGVGQVRYGPNGKAVADTVAKQVPGVSLVKDGRTDPSVDLVLGPRFDGLVKLPPAAPHSFRLNVYNTTYRTGLATEVADGLRKRGFRIGDVGNAAAMPKAPVEIHYGTYGEPAARRVALQVKGAKLVKDGRKGTSVDLLIGNDYTALVPRAQATPSPTPTPTPVTADRPPGC